METPQLRRALAATLTEIADLCETAALSASSHHDAERVLAARARVEVMRDALQAGADLPRDVYTGDPRTHERFVASEALSVLHREIDDAIRVAGISNSPERESWLERRSRLSATLRLLENHACMFALIAATLDENSTRELHTPFRLAVALRAGDEVPPALADLVTCHQLRTFDPFALGVITARTAPHLVTLLGNLLSTLNDVSVKDACDAARVSLPDPASLPGLEHHAPTSR